MFELIRSIDLGTERATGIAVVERDHPMLADHFPGRALLPGTWLVEIAAQIAGPLAEQAATGRFAVLAMIQQAKLLAPVELPAELGIEASITRRDGELVSTRATASVGGTQVLRTELVFALVAAPPEAIAARDARLAQWRSH